MIISMSKQFYLFLYSIYIGMIIGSLYDVFRIIRKIKKHSDIITYIEDVVYWIMVTFITFGFMFSKNYGQIRFFSIIGFVIGMILYFLTISSFILKIILCVIDILGKIFITTARIFFFPIKILKKILKSLLSPYIKSLKKNIKTVSNKSRRYIKVRKNKAIKDLKIILKKT